MLADSMESKKAIVDFDNAYPGELKGENINAIIERARQKRKKDDSER